MGRGKRYGLIMGGCFLLAVLSGGGFPGGRAEERGQLPAQARWRTDGAEVVLVPGGVFPMGSEKTEAEKPRHPVVLPPYYLDRTEVSWRRYLRFCEATGRRPPVNLAYEKNWPEEKMDWPVVNVTWDDAEAYCRWAGRRLPTEAEFEKACAGDKGRVYAWGNDWDAAACTSRINSNDHPSPVAGRPRCQGPYGHFDLSGNVWEWTADWYKSYPGSRLDFDFTGEQRVAKGGAYFYSIDLLRCASRYPLRPENFTEHGGFRCAASPGPGFAEKIQP